MSKNSIMKCVFLTLILYSLAVDAIASGGKDLYISRCAMCHGLDAKASGYLAKKSHPPTPDLTSRVFQERLAKYPGVIISAIVLQPNGSLIPDTLKRNHVVVPHHIWTDNELRSINQYILSLIKSKRCETKP